MFVPAFDRPGINRGKVDLSELSKVCIRALQHMEDGPPFIGDALQRHNLYSLNHRSFLSES
jgi:hypothetical protein